MKFRRLAGLVGLMAAVPFGVAVVSDSLDAQATNAAAAAATASDQVPSQYRALVNKAGSMCDGISAGIIAAQLNQESGWNPKASSPVGAQGIAQFMPSTWAAVGKDYSGDGKADVWDPADAIPAEGKYMCDQLSQIDADIKAGTIKSTDSPVSLALAAYNAGLGSVEAAGGVPEYDETKNYVATITANAAKYETSTTASDTATGGEVQASGDVQGALEWAKGIAADDSHGYVLGAEGPNYDCSGLSQAFMAKLGVSLVHKADTQARDDRGTIVASLDQAKPGDLLFYGTSSYYYHVAIYAGDNMMVSADNPASGINYEAVYGSPSLIRRFVK